MHMKMKSKFTLRKITTFFCIISIMLSSLTGCKKDTDLDITAGSDATKISFSWWGNDARHAYTMDGVDAFQEQNKDIDVEYRYGEWNGYETRMQVWMKSHTESDVMQINYAWLNMYSEDGMGYYDLYQLKDIIDLDNFTKEDLAFGEKNGKLNAIPIAFNTSTVYYNKEIYDSYGLDIPQTWDDYFAAAEVMKEDGIYPIGMGKKQMFLFLVAHFEQSTGKRVFDEDGRLLLDVEDMKMILEFYKRLIDEHVVPPIDQFTDTSFISGKVAGGMFWISDAGTYCKGLEEAGGVPVIGDYPRMQDKPLSGWYRKPATLYAISSLTEHPKEAARLLNYLLNDEGMAKLQGTEKGVPAGKTAMETLQKENLIGNYETKAHDKMLKERSRMNILLPIMENEEILNAFKQNADAYIYGVKDIDTTATQMYEQMNTIANEQNKNLTNPS